MAVTPTQIIAPAFVPNGKATIYTSTAAKTRIDYMAFTNESASNVTLSIWLGPVGASQRIKGTDGELVAAWNFLVELQPGASISIVWATDDLDTYLETFAASAFAPAIPSAIITITQEA